ncbi:MULTISPECIES: GNAT family N-acetyltransferase [Mycobacteriaceae]|uniref:N-acetyltransferase n=1 Tax=Mycolicibacterium mucogenicum DSM 44124 TaxID=1226753 RepID=A0A8H2JC09_MYCMU|nr:MULTISPECIES: GNAT family N-acetyltransferase [Mycobacteriaceae]KAB7758347.1 GCN5 family acetyltransferase [Mycolicibacterium mucogenicum DSM 44124]QPG71773.1 N-acetyltransferase [Mycolicibacterium mucogenicum DSM 44124]SEB20790.1 phosphinothricin acetyltransferase [Mycobacterium sp. 283mftsu]
MTTRTATTADLPAIADIYAHYVLNSVASFELESPAAEEWQARFARVFAAGLPFLVVEREGKVAGYAYCLPWKSRPAYQGTVEDSIYLAPWATGQGAGKELLGALLDAARAAGVREVIAVIADSGDPSSIALHKKLGFDEAGRLRQVGHKHGRDIDTVLLQCSLG